MKPDRRSAHSSARSDPICNHRSLSAPARARMRSPKARPVPPSLAPHPTRCTETGRLPPGANAAGLTNTARGRTPEDTHMETP